MSIDLQPASRVTLAGRSIHSHTTAIKDTRCAPAFIASITHAPNYLTTNRLKPLDWKVDIQDWITTESASTVCVSASPAPLLDAIEQSVLAGGGDAGYRCRYCTKFFLQINRTLVSFLPRFPPMQSLSARVLHAALPRFHTTVHVVANYSKRD